MSGRIITTLHIQNAWNQGAAQPSASKNGDLYVQSMLIYVICVGDWYQVIGAFPSLPVSVSPTSCLSWIASQTSSPCTFLGSDETVLAERLPFQTPGVLMKRSLSGCPTYTHKWGTHAGWWGMRGSTVGDWGSDLDKGVTFWDGQNIHCMRKWKSQQILQCSRQSHRLIVPMSQEIGWHS